MEQGGTDSCFHRREGSGYWQDWCPQWDPEVGEEQLFLRLFCVHFYPSLLVLAT